VAADTNGNVYVTGFSQATYATAKLDSTGSNVWTRTYVAITSPGSPKAVSQKVAVDSAGNVYVAGWADNISYYQDGQWHYYSASAVLRYDPAGNLVRTNWPFNGYKWGTTVGLIPDNQGNVYVTANGDYTYQTARIDANGQPIWGYLNGSPFGVTGMVLDAKTNVYLTGGVYSGFAYGTIKLDSNGNLLFQTNYFGTSSSYTYNQANGIALDIMGNIYVTGFSASTGIGNDFATIKYDTNGNQQWVIRYNGPANGNDGATAIAVAPDGSIYVTGYSQNSSGGSDITTLKYAYPPVIQKQSDGSMQLQLAGTPGQSYTFQATTNFTSWNTLGSSLADTNGNLQYLDTNAPLFPHRFYRWSSSP
jgi:hypothetical protein